MGDVETEERDGKKTQKAARCQEGLLQVRPLVSVLLCYVLAQPICLDCSESYDQPTVLQETPVYRQRGIVSSWKFPSKFRGMGNY